MLQRMRPDRVYLACGNGEDLIDGLSDGEPLDCTVEIVAEFPHMGHVLEKAQHALQATSCQNGWYEMRAGVALQALGVVLGAAKPDDVPKKQQNYVVLRKEDKRLLEAIRDGKVAGKTELCEEDRTLLKGTWSTIQAISNMCREMRTGIDEMREQLWKLKRAQVEHNRPPPRQVARSAPPCDLEANWDAESYPKELHENAPPPPQAKILEAIEHCEKVVNVAIARFTSETEKNDTPNIEDEQNEDEAVAAGVSHTSENDTLLPPQGEILELGEHCEEVANVAIGRCRSETEKNDTPNVEDEKGEDDAVAAGVSHTSEDGTPHHTCTRGSNIHPPEEWYDDLSNLSSINGNESPPHKRLKEYTAARRATRKYEDAGISDAAAGTTESDISAAREPTEAGLQEVDLGAHLVPCAKKHAGTATFIRQALRQRLGSQAAAAILRQCTQRVLRGRDGTSQRYLVGGNGTTLRLAMQPENVAAL